MGNVETMSALQEVGRRTRGHVGRGALLLGLVGGALLGGERTALADPAGPDALPITVVAVKSDDALDQAEALTQALGKAVRDAKGWSLEEGKVHSLEFLILQMKCSEPIDAACEARIAEVIKADRYIWGTLDMSGKTEVKGTLHMFVRGKGTSTAPLKYSANLTEPTDDSLVRVAVEAVNTVTGGPPNGGLRVTAGGIEGQLYVDDQPIGALPKEGGTFQLPAGEHRIVVKAKGYADAETTIKVRPATTVDAQLTMEVQEESAPVDGRMVGGFVSLAVGVGVAAVGLWAALDVNALKKDETYSNYQALVPASQDVCDYAKDGMLPALNPGKVSDICDEARTMEIIQAVMFPTAAVAVGVGGFLLGTSSLAGEEEPTAEEAPAEGAPAPEEPAVTWSLEPYVGPDLQWVQLRARF